ncbi:OmpH/Skp family outer membrane protein [Ferruginibacter sp.]
MKKITVLLCIFAGIVFAKGASAQGKTGYISVDAIVSIMPETGKIDSLMQRYQADTLNPQYTMLTTTYQAKLNLYNDSLKTTAAVHKMAADDLSMLIYQIQNWEQIQNQAMESKRNALLGPIYRKAYDAIKAVAKEKNIVHVFNKEAFLVAPDGEDMITAVAAKLKITLPKTATAGIK